MNFLVHGLQQGFLELFMDDIFPGCEEARV
jgi:hypothetical protein